MNRRSSLTLPTTPQFLFVGKATKYRLSVMLLIACAALIASAVRAPAQSQNVQHTENRADQSLRGNFRVDPSTLGMSFSIPLAGYPGRAGNHVPVTLNYNSKLWRVDYDYNAPWLNQMRTWTKAKYAETSTSGWTSSLEIPFIEYTGRNQFYDTAGDGLCQFCEQEDTGWPFYIKRIHVHLSDGSSHELKTEDGPIPFDPQNPGGDFSGIFKAVDGSGMYFDSSSYKLHLPDGSVYFFSSTEVGIHGKQGLPAIAYIDRNGNTLSFNIQNRSWSDTLGRTLYDPIPNQPPAPGEQTYTLPGIYQGGPTTLTYKLRWANLGNVLRIAAPLRYTGDRKCSAQITQWSPALFQTFDTLTFLCANLGAGGNPELFNPVVLSEVELPNGQKYQFKYNIYGEIEQVFLPTGGYERYEYGEIQALSLPEQPYKQSNRGVTSRWVSVDGTTELPPSLYSLVSASPYTLRATAPDNSYTERVIIKGCLPLPSHCPFGLEPVTAGMVEEERAYTPTGQMLRRSLTEWLLPGRPTKEVSIILDTGGNALATTTTYQYDADRNVISSSKYDFASISQATGQTGAINSIPSGPLVRTEETTFLVNDPDIDAGTKTAYRLRNLIGLPTSTRVKNAAGTIVAKSEFKYDEGAYPLLTYGAVVGWSDPGTIRGLVTTTRSWLNTTGNWLETHAQYDQCGSPRKIWDARGFLSEMEYSGVYHRAYMTQSTSPDPDGAGAVTPLVSSAIFDLTTGVVLSRTDANIKTTTFEYSDFATTNPFQRLTKVVQPDGGWTAHAFSDTPGNLNVVTKTALDASRNVQSTQYFDGLGRAWRSVKSEGATSIYVDTQYDSVGRVWKVSNPYRSGETIVWTTNGYDALSRTVSMTTPDGAQVGSAYGGSTSGTLGSTVTVTDQSGKKRKSVTDALGRLREVYEDPLVLNYLTSYSYDVLDSLTTVTQGGQTRTFAYDSLKRLTSATNPEICNQVGAQCTPIPVTYQYDNNGNLTLKTDARGVTSTYVYDTLNRNTSVNYSDSTPDILRQYDLAINGKGRLNQAWQSGTTTSATYIDSYDALGRPLIQRQRYETSGVWSASYQTSRVYNLAGGVTSQIYPSGRTIDYTYDDAGRTLSLTGNLGDGVTRTYASGISYSAFGGLQQEQFGTQTPLYHKLHYNIRGQMYDVRLSTVAWATDQWNWNRGALVLYFGYPHQQSGPLNNGNVSMMQHYVPANEQVTAYNFTEQRYVYDSLNRLTSAAEYPATQAGYGAVSFTQIFDYDRWGNRTINLATTNAPEPQFAASSATNRLGVAPGYSGRMDYDAAGNLVNDTYTSFGRTDGTPTRLYDAENRLTTAKDATLQVVSSYSYNADGQRTRRKVGSVETWNVYGMEGELLAEYTAGAATFVPTKEYGYRNGQLLVTVSSGDDRRLTRFVQNLYFGALQIELAPTSPQVTDKVNQLAAAGAQSEAQLLVKAKEIARSLFAQTTYETNPSRSDTQYVTDLYYAYLQRGPDAGGLSWWLPQVAGSVQNRINVLNGFEASGEFEALANTLYGTAPSDNQRTENFVTNFYQGAFSAPPNSTQLATNSATLNNAAAVSQPEVISAAETMGRSLFVAQVNDAGLSNSQFVTNLYEAFLQRGPDASGLAFWSGGATVGQGRQNALNAFATCPPFRELAGTLYREAYWLVADHLGTPRMVVNKSGALASVKRHDYLPFGEELGLIGGRSTGMGYNSTDTVRQKFTSKERDNETGLDYFLARYYSSTQGRFTSPDEFTGGPDELYYFVDDASANPTFYADLGNPQSLNKYQYAYNNPLRYIDPDGHDGEEADPDLQNPSPVMQVPIVRRVPPLTLPGQPLPPMQNPQFVDDIADQIKRDQKRNETAILVGTTLIEILVSPRVDPDAIPAIPLPRTPAQPLPPPPMEMARRGPHKPKKQSTGKNPDHKEANERPGAPNKQPPGFKPRTPPRPQDIPPKPVVVPPKKKPEPKSEIGTREKSSTSPRSTASVDYC